MSGTKVVNDVHEDVPGAIMSKQYIPKIARHALSFVINLPERIAAKSFSAIVTADSAYDTRRCHTAIISRQASAIIPIRKNGRPWKEDWVRLKSPETKPFARPGTAAGHSGSAGPDTTLDSGLKPRCPRRFARTCRADPARPQSLQ